MTITCTLSAQSLMAAAKQLREYARSLDDKAKELVNELGDYGLDSAANTLGHFDTGETLSSLEYVPNGTSGKITVGGNAVWIEFGTGVTHNGDVGSYPHPLAQDLGMDAIGTYGKGHGASRYGWWYPDGGTYKHTFGIKSVQFMYRASQDMRRELIDIAKEVFAND